MTALPLAILGVGVVAAPGRGVAAYRAALATGRDGLALAPGCGLPRAAVVPVGVVADPLPRVPGRTAALAVAAAEEALLDAGLARDDRGEVAVLVGTCTAGMTESEAAYLADPAVPAAAYRRHQAHHVAGAVARATRCGGPRSVHCVACASAASAVAEACAWIRLGLCETAVVVGADALCRVTTSGFTALQLVDPQGCRPLTVGRAGMSLGEGAGALVITTPAAARRRGARVRASLLGWGVSADGHHQTSPDPSGTHLRNAIDAALSDAGVGAAAVDFVCAHGTGTRDNDAVEAAVIAGRCGAVPTASWKRLTGHTMGACAAIEAVGCVLALESQRHWGSAGAAGAEPVPGLAVVPTTRPGRVEVALSTTLAFGGTNAALVLGRAERAR
jgi:3-oxoacyl-(acyl-carrier-protein) synthase